MGRDAVGALAVLVVFATPQIVAPERYESTAASVIALVVASAALVWRRTSPLLSTGVVVAVMVVSAAVDADSSLAFGPGLIAIYTVAACRGRAQAALATAVTAVAYPAVLVAGGMEPMGSSVVLVVVLLVLAATLGLAVGAQRAVVAAARDRAARAEESREVEAARRVTQERLRIARELHDVVAHHVAVISVQAGAAEALFDKRPAAAREAIGHARDAGERVLVEMSSLLHLLREPDDSPSAAPAPGVASLPALLDEARATGLEVVERTHGSPRALPAVVDLTVYRVVQEALTNAHRHGAGRAEVALVHGQGAVIVEVVNPFEARAAADRPGAPGGSDTTGRSGGSVAPGGARADTAPVALGPSAGARAGAAPRPPGAGAAQGSGLGLIGLRERVAAVGGTSEIGSRDGVWVVRVELPVPGGRLLDDGVPSAADTPSLGADLDPAPPTAQEAP